jgi:hypothetical protein
MRREDLRAARVLVALLLASSPVGAQREPTSTKPEFDLTPFDGRGALRSAEPELIPILAGDEVLVTSTLRLFAFDASTAELRWIGGPPEGWDALLPNARSRLFEDVDTPRLWVVPAAGERVAVAALLVPQVRRSLGGLATDRD